MALRKSTKAKATVETEERPDENQSNGAKKKLELVRTHYKCAVEADEDNRRDAMADFKFLNIPGQQWDKNQKKNRGKRPCYEFNKLRVAVKRVINDIRANRPQGKVRAVEDGDKDTADIYEGLIRNIWNTSDGDTIIDYAAEYQVGCGMGAWRIDTEYCADSVSDQNIKIRRIKNPFCLYGDPNASDPMRRDAEYWILTEKISEAAFKKKYPNAPAVDFEDDEFDDHEEWNDSVSKTVRICEYWYKEPIQKEIALLSNGETVNLAEVDLAQLAQQQIGVIRQRTVDSHKIMMLICSGSAILEQPTEWAGKYFPFVQIYGEWLVIDGKVYWWGLTRDGKDAQRSYNVSRTAITETIASAPQSKFWTTPKQMEGLSGVWQEAHEKLFPFLPYNPDQATGGAPPQRMGGPDVPVALMQEAQIASNEIKETTGVFDSRETGADVQSGKAIIARERQGAISNFNYADNMSKGIRWTWEIIVDLIPKIIDTERAMRILGADGAEKYIKVNTFQVDPRTGEKVVVNDLSKGTFDVAITTGPGYATQRQEATEVYTELGRALPAIWTVAGDLIFKSMDLPYADQIAERMKSLLPPQIQQTLGEGKPLPPEVAMVMQQADQAMQQVQQQTAMLQQAAQEVQQDKAQADKAKSDAQAVISDIEVKRAQFEAFVAKQMANLAQKEAALSQHVAKAQSDADRQAVEGERKTLQSDAQLAMQHIQATAQQFEQFAHQAMAEILQKEQALSDRVNQEISMLMQTVPQPVPQPDQLSPASDSNQPMA